MAIHGGCFTKDKKYIRKDMEGYDEFTERCPCLWDVRPLVGELVEADSGKLFRIINIIHVGRITGTLLRIELEDAEPKKKKRNRRKSK